MTITRQRWMPPDPVAVARREQCERRLESALVGFIAKRYGQVTEAAQVFDYRRYRDQDGRLLRSVSAPHFLFLYALHLLDTDADGVVECSLADVVGTLAKNNEQFLEMLP